MISIEKKKPYKQWLRSPYMSDNKDFEFQFEFEGTNNGVLRASNLLTGDQKIYPFQITEEDDVPYVTIAYLPVSNLSAEIEVIKKDLKAILHFLVYNVSDLETQFIESEVSLKSTIKLLSNPIVSKNGKIEFQYIFLTDKSGTLKIIDNRLNKITEGTFNLLFSDDYNTWFIDMHANISIRTSHGDYPLLGCFSFKLFEYLNKISN